MSSTNAVDLYNSSSSLAFQDASLFFLRSSDMYAYFASQLNNAYYILNLWQSHHRQIFLDDHSPVNRWQYVLGFCRLSMYRNCIGGSHHLRFMSHTLRSTTIYNFLSFCFWYASACFNMLAFLSLAFSNFDLLNLFLVFTLLFLTWT